MANEMDFESFENLDDLDWSELEKDIKDSATQEEAAPAPGGGVGEMPARESGAPVLTSSDSNIDINYLLDVNLEVTVEIGRRNYLISEVLAWDQGSIIELERLVGETLNLLVNGKTVARGEVVVVNDKFALRVAEILDPHDRLNFLQS